MIAAPGGSGSAKKGAVIFGGDKDREPIGGGGAGFFDPGRLSDEGPAGGALQIRGYLGVNFMVTERTNRSARDPETGKFQQLSTLPYFGGGAANIYVGAPIYSDVVYARVAFEFLSVPRADVGAADVAPVWAPVVLMESAALEINPFAWADKSGRWLREGFKITAGVFIVPFGLEDEEHDAPEVVASGRGEMAKLMIDAARAYGVPVVRDIPVARALVELEVGEQIPEELFEAVAEILKEVYAEQSE